MCAKLGKSHTGVIDSEPATSVPESFDRFSAGFRAT